MSYCVNSLIGSEGLWGREALGQRVVGGELWLNSEPTQFCGVGVRYVRASHG